MTDANDDLFGGAEESKALSVSNTRDFPSLVKQFEAFEGNGHTLAFASGDIYRASQDGPLKWNNLVGVRNIIDNEDNYAKMSMARKYAKQVSLVQQLSNLQASLWGRGFKITHPLTTVEQAYRNLIERFKFGLDIPLLMRDLSQVTNSAIIWAKAEGSADLAYLKVYRPESTRIQILTDTLWLKPSDALKKEITNANDEQKKAYLDSLKPQARKKAEKQWDSIRHPGKFGAEHRGWMPITEKDGEYWRIIQASGGSSKQSYETVAMQSIFTDIELLKMLIEGDWATAYLIKNMYVLVTVGESITGNAALAGSRRNWAKPKDIDNLKAEFEKTGQAQIIYGNHTIKVEFKHPDEKVFSPEKYDAVINRICTFFGIGHYMILGASGGSSRGASYAAAAWNVQAIRTKAAEERQIVNLQLKEVYKHDAIISAAFMETGDVTWHNCFSSVDGNMLKFVDTNFSKLSKDTIGIVQYSRNGFSTFRDMTVKAVNVDNSSLILSGRMPANAEPEQFRLMMTGKQSIELFGAPTTTFDQRGLKEDRQVLAEVIAAKGDGVISALTYAQELGWQFDEEIAQKQKELEIPELLVPIFERNQGMVEKILARILDIAVEEIENGDGAPGESGRPETRPEGQKDTNENPKPSTASIDPDDEDLAELKIAVWKSLKNVPVRLKSMHGAKLTLAQINGIARQAEAAEENGADNGWAVARASFQKTHHIKDGKWVKNKG